MFKAQQSFLSPLLVTELLFNPYSLNRPVDFKNKPTATASDFFFPSFLFFSLFGVCASVYITDALALGSIFYTVIASMHPHVSLVGNSSVLHYVCTCMRNLICSMAVSLLVEIDEVEG